MKTLITIAIIAMSSIVAQAQLSAEALGVIRHINIHDGPAWGAGVGIGYKFNPTVTGRLRLVAYEADNWGGGAIDESSALFDARLFGTKCGRLSLSAVGGVDRDWGRHDWGFSVGGRAAIAITPRVYIAAGSRVRAWFGGQKDLVSEFGIGYLW